MKIKTVLGSTFALLIICLLVTAALSVTNHFTKDLIAKQKNEQLAQTMEQLVPGATFTAQSDSVYSAVSNGQLQYVFLTQAMGYKSKVEVMTAIDQTGTITGVAVVNCSEESPGIGQKIGTDTGFLAQFKGVNHTMDSCDAITGATYSSVAVKDAVNVALEQFKTMTAETATDVQGGAQ